MLLILLMLLLAADAATGGVVDMLQQMRVNFIQPPVGRPCCRGHRLPFVSVAGVPPPVPTCPPTPGITLPLSHTHR